MRRLPHLMTWICLSAITFTADSWSQETRTQSPSRPLFNGIDLEGWVAVNTAPSTWTVEDGLLVCSGKPIGEIRTTRMYQNFVLELEWRHLKPAGNAGVFVWADDITSRGVPFHRSIEVQVLENSYGNSDSHTTHGDIFPIHGAEMKPINGRGGDRAFPTEFRAKSSPQWNRYRVECREGNISLAVNGKVVTRGEACIPSKGYICLESEGGIVHYRNIWITELPDTPIRPEHVAIANRGFRSLYSGVDLSGWQSQGDWQPADWRLQFRGDAEGRIATGGVPKDLGFIVDFHLQDRETNTSVIVHGVPLAVGRQSPYASHVDDDWNRLEGEIRDNQLSLTLNGKELESVPINAAAEASLSLVSDGPVEFANIFVRDLGE